MSPLPTDFISALALCCSPVLSFCEGHGVLQDFSFGCLQFRKDCFLYLDVFWGYLLTWHLTECDSGGSATVQK